MSPLPDLRQRQPHLFRYELGLLARHHLHLRDSTSIYPNADVSGKTLRPPAQTSLARRLSSIGNLRAATFNLAQTCGAYRADRARCVLLQTEKDGRCSAARDFASHSRRTSVRACVMCVCAGLAVTSAAASLRGFKRPAGTGTQQNTEVRFSCALKPIFE